MTDQHGLKSFYTKVVGVTRENEDGTSRQKIIGRLKAGDKAALRREPDNRYDPNAVAVCTASGEQIGYLSREVAAEIAPLLDQGTRVDAEVSSLTGGGLLYKRTRGVNLKLAR